MLYDAGDHPLVVALLADQRLTPSTKVSSADPMLRAARNRGFDRALVDYFLRGIEALNVTAALVGDRKPVLEFASGWGRMTRFLTLTFGTTAVVASDIDDEAVGFCRDVLGVRALPSARSPDQFQPNEAFPAIVAYSLFSHLPPETFGPWLKRLWSLLLPDGLLVISVHDERLIDAGVRDATGITFRQESESTRLSKIEYGSTWVSRAYTERMVRESCPGSTLLHIPYGLSSYQDLYVISRTPLQLTVDIGPFGYFSVCKLAADELLLAGWAAHRDPRHSAEDVVVTLGSTLLGRAAPTMHRPDVVDHTGDPRFARSGWVLRRKLPSAASLATDVLMVKAVSDTGIETVLYAGTLADALLESTRDELRSLSTEFNHCGDVLAMTLKGLGEVHERLARTEELVERLTDIDSGLAKVSEAFSAQPWTVRLRRLLRIPPR